MGHLISLDRALDRLLYQRSYRDDFLAGRSDRLDLSPEDVASLATIDREQLVRTVERVREDLLGRKHRGSGGLLALFPRTIEAFRAAHPEDPELRELLFSFMESEPWQAHRELPFSGPGLCLEEAFYRFAEAEAIGEPATREQEFLTAMLKALLLSPSPDFTLPAEIRRAPRGFFAIGARGEPALHAAVGGRLILGPITPFLAELLTSTDPPAEVAERHGVSPTVREASIEKLVGLGLLAR